MNKNAVTWRQKNDADRRSEWWRRTQWAFERTFNEDNVQAELELRWKMLNSLVSSRLATSDDSDIVQVIAEHAILRSLEVLEEVGDGGEGEHGPS